MGNITLTVGGEVVRWETTPNVGGGGRWVIDNTLNVGGRSLSGKQH